MNAEYFALLRRLSQPIRAAELPHTLDHVHRLLDALGNPQHNFKSVVVTGSTGKGTTCVRLANFLSITGRKVGLYTSPHLHSFRERMVIVEPFKGDPLERAQPHRITQAEFVEHARAVLAEQESLGQPYSTFESATALALLWFARQKVDIAVLEIGIGGRFDAVNAVPNVLSVFTPIEAEHVAMLGGSLESVAWHKAGIIQPNGRAITVPQTPDVLAVLEREAAEKQAVLTVAEDTVKAADKGDLFAPLTPPQLARGNGELRSFAQAGRGDKDNNEGHGALPGRLETVTVGSRRVIIDGGHTPAAAHHLLQAVGDAASVRVVVGMLRDKNAAAYLSTLDMPHVHFVYTQAPGDRALASSELLERFRPALASITVMPDLSDALASITSAPEALIVVAGSLRMAAAAREAFGLLTPDELEEARLTRAIFEGDEYQGKLKRGD